MEFKILSRWNGSVLFSLEAASLKLTVEAAIKSRANLSRANLSEANLYGANLPKADLSEANLYGANLSEANLYGANLSRANLSEANLYGANLYGANLSEANLYGANLYGANLPKADLYEANLSRANLSRANLSEAKIKFALFPSIKTLALIDLGSLSDTLSLELMRRDATAHPFSERFDIWAKGGDCPYRSEERFWLFNSKRELWKKGKPKMTDVELIKAICAEKGWGLPY